MLTVWPYFTSNCAKDKRGREHYFLVIWKVPLKVNKDIRNLHKYPSIQKDMYAIFND